jgi:L-lactate dehydrogenase complex protein LldG
LSWRRIRNCGRSPWSDRPLLRIREGRAEATDMVSVQHGFAAIAETGTLMLPSAPERPTTLNLLTDTAIVVLRAERRGRGV